MGNISKIKLIYLLLILVKLIIHIFFFFFFLFVLKNYRGIVDDSYKLYPHIVNLGKKKLEENYFFKSTTYSHHLFPFYIINATFSSGNILFAYILLAIQ